MKETIVTRDGHTITRMDLSDLGPITQMERDMIQEAAKRPVTVSPQSAANSNSSRSMVV